MCRKLKILKLKFILFLKRKFKTKNKIKPIEPRYDQIYFDGVDWLDSL